MRRPILVTTFHAAALLMAAAFAPHAASQAQPGTSVQVSYINAANFIDAGDWPGQNESTMTALTRHLEALGQRWLPTGARLEIQVLQIDLAGYVEPAVQQSQRLRVLRGGGDWPRIDLRYTLTRADGTTVRGEESLNDKTYLLRPIQGRDAGDPLRFERRLLSQWFETRFGSKPGSTPRP